MSSSKRIATPAQRAALVRARAIRWSKPASAKHRAASRKNLEKAWRANRARWVMTPARLANSLRTIKLAQAAIRGRPRQLSPAQLEAVRGNVAKARATLQARGRSPEHLARLRQTIVKARAARTPEGLRRGANQRLEHGMDTRRLREAMKHFGDDPREYDALLQGLRAYFAPGDPAEEGIVKMMGEALWRHTRLYSAYARWEWDAVRALLAASPPYARLEPPITRVRAYSLLAVLGDRDRFFRRDRCLTGSIERLLRRLLRLRTGGDPKFQTTQRIGGRSAMAWLDRPYRDPVLDFDEQNERDLKDLARDLGLR